MNDSQYGAAASETAPATGQTRGTQQSEAHLKVGQDELPIGSVLLVKSGNQPSRLLFFRDDVDCVTVKETRQGADQALVSVEVEPGTDGLPRIARTATWVLNAGGKQGKAQASPSELVMTAVPASDVVEGRVMLSGKLQDDYIELKGPFKATVCEVSATAAPMP